MKKILCILAALMLTAVSASAAQLTETEIRAVTMGSGRSSVHEQIGSPAAVTGNGGKETYELSSDKTAVLQYDGDTLSRGFIIN